MLSPCCLATGGHPWDPPAWASAQGAATAEDGCSLPPFRWDDDSPKDVYGPDFPGETFRQLKEKRYMYGEYRTRWLVLGAWDRLRR